MYPTTDSPPLNNRLQAIRKTTVAFASLFKDIPFIKYDNNGVEIERIKVPIIYGNKEKYVKRLDIPHEKVQITLPRIEYGLLDVVYDPSRRTNQANKIVACGSNGSAYTNSPLPYNFNFELVLYTRNIEDANQIMEYILPFFYPDYNMKITLVPELNVVKNIPITFNGDSLQDDSSGSFDEPVRSVFRTLTFTARSFIYQPPRYYKPILQAETNISIPSSGQEYTLASNGTGTFFENEAVFQGVSFNRATATATVKSWNPNTRILKLNIKGGSIKANTKIFNVSKTAEYIVRGLPNSGLAFATKITPTPNTYPVTTPFNYNIEIQDYTE
jgi:hypothetical protein